jgi:mitochondrial import inner membrane translocase subunit TIM44
MNSLRYTAVRTPSHTRIRFVSRYGRTATYRRLLNLSGVSSIHHSSICSKTLSLFPPGSYSLSGNVRSRLAAIDRARSIHYGARLSQKNKDPVKDTPKEDNTSSRREKEATDRPGANQDGTSGDGSAKNEHEEVKNKRKQDKKDDPPPPPPPPHGNKSPWQVFTETLQSEFKASKEWNESTKALASSAHQFTESESVKRARQAYEAGSSAVSSTTANVFKTTAGAVGKGATWTWETPVVKGVRSTVNATGSLIEKSTRPIRETEAFKNVKNVIDDGSSSRYGGWVEKEERRKAREKRKQEEAQAGLSGKQREVPKEDPK